MPQGRPPKVEHVRDEFIQNINSAKDLVNQVLRFEGIHPNTQKATLHSKHVRKVVELAFMGVVASWEEFLERTFVRYMAGAETSNLKPTLKVGRADSLEHSYQLLAEDPNYDSAKDYLKFSTPKWVIMKAKFYFKEAKPYDVLHGETDKLLNANKIRHRVAHSSRKCKADFKEVAIKFLDIRNGTLTQGFGAGDLLLKPAQRHFGQSAKDRGITFFEAYMEFYEYLANRIVS